MSRSIYSKFIIGYLLFGLVGFIAVALFSQKMTYNYLVKQNADKFYDEAVLLSLIHIFFYLKTLISILALK